MSIHGSVDDLLRDEPHREQRREVVGTDRLLGAPGAAAAAAARAGPAARCTRRSGSGRLRQIESDHAFLLVLVDRDGARPARRRARPVVGADEGLADEHRVEPGARPSAPRPPGCGSRSRPPRSSPAGDARRARPRPVEVLVNVTRLRAFTPTIRASSRTARSTSAASWASTSTPSPSDQRELLQVPDVAVVGERGEDQQDRVGTDGPGLVDLHRVDREVLAQDRERRTRSRAAWRSSTVPPKYARSVSTLSADGTTAARTPWR